MQKENKCNTIILCHTLRAVRHGVLHSYLVNFLTNMSASYLLVTSI